MKTITLLLSLLCCLTMHAEEKLKVLKEHEDYTNVFTVTNPYERAIKVEKIDTTCTCIELEIGKKFLLPNESTTLNVRVSNERTSGIRNYKVWIYVTDPEYAAIEIRTKWEVIPDVAVDLIKEDPEKRPENKKYRDIYRYISNVKPDEGKRLKKYVRLSTPADLEGGFQVTPTYEGKIWKFTTKTLDAKSVLLIAKAKDPSQKMEEGLFSEVVKLKTNNPHKSTFSLQFNTSVDLNAGNKDQKADGFDGPAIPFPGTK